MTTQPDLSNQDMLTFATLKKNEDTAYILCLLLGGFGAHYFYLKNVKRGVFYAILLIVASVTYAYFSELSAVDKVVAVAYPPTRFFLVVGVIVSLMLGISLIVDLFKIDEKVEKYNAGILRQLTERASTKPFRKLSSSKQKHI